MTPVIMEDVGIAMNRRQRAKAATTAKVLEAARDLFETVGFEGATMRAIAKQAGMSTGAIFANYRDKAELYLSVYGHRPISPDAGRNLLNQASAAIAEVHKAFGAPGDYGYESREGKALYLLYRAFNAIVAACPPPPEGRS